MRGMRGTRCKCAWACVRVQVWIETVHAAGLCTLVSVNAKGLVSRGRFRWRAPCRVSRLSGGEEEKEEGMLRGGRDKGITDHPGARST